MMRVSVLIPYKPDYGRRDDLWSYAQKRYALFMPYIEICVGRDDSVPFCRSKAVNEAAKKATGDIFIIADTDVIFNPGLIIRLLAVIDQHPWVVPFQNGYKLTRQKTDEIIARGHQPVIWVNPDDYEYIQPGPGPLMNAMKRSCFEMIGGLDERFRGYGYEDMAMVMALETLCGHYFVMETEIFHLWHEPVDMKSISPNNTDLWMQYNIAFGNREAMRKLIQGGGLG
jgi:glycosyltransferase involved in cell wall biosynthesis